MLGTPRQSLAFAAAMSVILMAISWGTPVFWWLLVTAAIGGAIAGSRPALEMARDQIERSRRRRSEISSRAELQNRWVLEGDNRGVYGATGAALMRHISPLPDLEPHETEAAAVVYTADALKKLLTDKLPGWRSAAFASVVVQRQSAVAARLLDVEIGYAPMHREPVYGAQHLHAILHRLLAAMVENMNKVEALMKAPSFTTVFAPGSLEDTGRAEDIVHMAHRLMDYHERYLIIVEQCLALDVSPAHTDLQRDCARYLAIPLNGFRPFVNDMVERMAEMGEVQRWARAPIELPPVYLGLDDDDKLRKRVFRGLKTLGR